MTRISSRITSFCRHNDVVCDEIRVIAPHMPNSNKYNFDFMKLSFRQVLCGNYSWHARESSDRRVSLLHWRSLLLLLLLYINNALEISFKSFSLF